MRKNLMMNFVVDKENKQIKVEREFDAALKSVWAAWTESEILDRWWAPKPWKARTKTMDFREGGYWLYAMVGPEGEEHWAIAEYQKIEPLKVFIGYDAFCDENGKINENLPRTKWEVVFRESGDSTIVNITNSFEQLSDLEKIIEMGFKEGFTAGLENLDHYLLNHQDIK